MRLFSPLVILLVAGAIFPDLSRQLPNEPHSKRNPLGDGAPSRPSLPHSGTPEFAIETEVISGLGILRYC